MTPPTDTAVSSDRPLERGVRDSGNQAPCARVQPGETVVFETQWAFGDHDVKQGDKLSDLDQSKCDPLTGPVYVESAEPGDTLAVHILDIELVGQGGQGIIPGLGVLEWDDLPVQHVHPS